MRTVPLFFVAALLTAAIPASSTAPLLANASEWQPVPAEGVEMHVSAVPGPHGEPGLRIDYDFHGHGGWAAAKRTVPIALPARYEIRFLLRGDGPRNNLELKLTDPSGDNVWWHVDRAREWPVEWSPVRIKSRQVTFAWGPAPPPATGGGELRQASAIELTVSAAEGGRGTIWVAGLEIVEVPPLASGTTTPTATADAAEPASPAAAALDGDERTAWRPGAAGGALTVDLGGLREFGGVTLGWSEHGARRFLLETSSDGKSFTTAREVVRGGALHNELMLPDAEARFLRLRLPAGACGDDGCGLAELLVRPLEYGATPGDFLGALAATAPRGTWPRGYVEGTYWTVVGEAGDPQESLVSEDGAVESGYRGFSLEPFLRLGDHLYTWADATVGRALADGDLPLPTVTWQLPGATLEIAPVAAHVANHSSILVRYRLHSESSAPLHGELVVAARPLQVDPPYQFLNGGGGVAPLRRLACDGALLEVEGAAAVAVDPPPHACGTLAFDEGPLRERLAAGEPPNEPTVDDGTQLATAALRWKVDLPARGRLEVVAAMPYMEPAAQTAAATPVTGARFAAELAAARRSWRAALDRVGIELPPAAAPLLRSARSSLAWILIHRDGPAIQPGSRAYARSWIRDGALTGVALLRLRHGEEAAQFTRWFAGFQYPDGKVPCCVDRRGADPVPENDSHGELVHIIAEVARYGGDRALATELFPHVEKAVDAIEALRQQRRTDEYRSGAKQIFFGLLPESISHEGYSAKPVHSYWDDTFAYRGLDDAVSLATWLGKADLAREWGRRRDELRTDLLASIARVRVAQKLDTIPASADLADFDPTSTTTMLDPGGLLGFLPRDAVLATFDKFWHEIEARRAGTKEWDAYTPYEQRHVGAFLRLAVAEPAARETWRERAYALLAYYHGDQRPPEWNAWPEVVTREPRKRQFLGDLPHGWVASDYLRSFLDLFAYERVEDQALVLGAGVRADWLTGGHAVAVRGLATPYGPLTARWTATGGGVRCTIAGGLRLPPGGIVVVPPAAPGTTPRWSARVDGRPAALAADGTVVVRRLPATIELAPTTRSAS